MEFPCGGIQEKKEEEMMEGLFHKSSITGDTQSIVLSSKTDHTDQTTRRTILQHLCKDTSSTIPDKFNWLHMNVTLL